jgi:pimeloyl-ACP methyl ester carboxylesterase
MPSPVTTWDSWRSTATDIESGGSSVATYDLGSPSASPLTFLHGFPSSSLDIAPVAALLDDRWRVLTLDMPGFGASAKPAGHPYTIHAATDAVEALWSARSVTSTLLVAHDYSVSVAQELLARRIDGSLGVDVTGVVWMNGGIYPDLHRPTFGQQMMLDPDNGAEVAAAITETTFVSGVRGTWGERCPFDPVETHEMFASMDERGGISIMHELLHYIADRRTHQARWQQSLETTDVRSVFVWGDLDPVSGAHMIERVEERIPMAEIDRMADVGHWPLLEAPDVVAAHIDELG